MPTIFQPNNSNLKNLISSTESLIELSIKKNLVQQVPGSLINKFISSEDSEQRDYLKFLNKYLSELQSKYLKSIVLIGFAMLLIFPPGLNDTDDPLINGIFKLFMIPFQSCIITLVFVKNTYQLETVRCLIDTFEKFYAAQSTLDISPPSLAPNSF